MKLIATGIAESEAGPDEPFRLERFIPYRLSVLTNLLSRAIGRLYGRRFGLAIPEWRVMAVLARFAPLAAAELCTRTAMDKVQVSRAVARLKAAGYIVRSVDTADRRRSRLRLSSSGRAVHDAIVPMARAAEAKFIADLAPADRATLDRLLGLLLDRAQTLDAAGNIADKT
ncbi:MAG: winged helix-turn-helix transcriptional regulator [Proteobacteria bacterium]|nr:winged helix-turn-helix transcriptional regulator [Pseudomonadota bacterium]